MPDLSTFQKVKALKTLRQVSMGKHDSVLLDLEDGIQRTVIKLLTVAVTQLESRIIELEKQNVWSP